MIQKPNTILITGASSGIGRALAHRYAAPDTTLFLGGRNARNLADTAKQCAERGATCHTNVQDVTDRHRMEAWVRACDDMRSLELVVANAGVSAGTGTSGEDRDQIQDIMATNVDGVFNTVVPVIERMVERGTGQIAIIASLAGYIGFPGAPAYCASKAALRIWGEAQRTWLAPRGVRVSVVCPGFVRTPMSSGNPYPMPFIVDADVAAEKIQKGLERNRACIAFAWQANAIIRFLSLLPQSVRARFLLRTPGKPSVDEQENRAES